MQNIPNNFYQREICDTLSGIKLVFWMDCRQMGKKESKGQKDMEVEVVTYSDLASLTPYLIMLDKGSSSQ